MVLAKHFLKLVCCLLPLVACGTSTRAEYHRANDALCAKAPPATDDSMCVARCGNASVPSCHSDADCTAGTYGRCMANLGGGPADPNAPEFVCTYDACKTDSDCPAQQTCACHTSPYVGQTGNTCVPGECRVDADCGSQGDCSPTTSVGQCGQFNLVGYYCHTKQDECVNDSDCGDKTCAYSAQDARWTCQGPLEVCL